MSDLVVKWYDAEGSYVKDIWVSSLDIPLIIMTLISLKEIGSARCSRDMFNLAF